MGKRPLRPYGGVVRTSTYAPRLPQEEVIPLVSARINGGINTSTDAADIDPSQVVDAKNCRVRYDKTSRRSGTEAFGDTKPNSNPVLALYAFRANDGTETLLRFTHSGIHRNPTSWSALTGTLTGTASNRFNIATAFNSIVFTNGVDEIQTIDLGAGTFGDLGNAQKYKFCTVFANRVVGAYYNEASVDPIRVGWSANGLPAEWDPLINISAGFGSIIESPGDLSDHITGIFGFTNVMIIPRERSLWLATKQPVATQPFNFVAAVPGIGFGCPYASAVIPGGLIGADHRTEKVYAYVPGEQPLSISSNVEREIFRSLTNPEDAFGSYDNRNNEYSIAVPLVGSNTVRVWVYNFRTQAWTYDERELLTCIADIEGAGSNLTIDDLVGTIEELVGTIDELVDDETSATSRLYGFSEGDIEIERLSETSDAGAAFDNEVVSKTWYLPVTDQYVTSVRYEVYCRTTTTFSLYYSKDGGKTWTLARTDTVDTLDEPYVIKYNRQVKCRKFTFKITSSDGDWDLIDYELSVVRSGPTQSSAIGSV